ncbi:MAG: hypothetical protein ACR2O3_17255 [Rhizobiaceae bacterium]
MANFEGLIRGALRAKDATSPEVRRRVYESSRNALKRLIEENRSLTVEAALREQRSLEDAIDRIEEEYIRPSPEPELDNDPLFELKQILLEDSDEFRKASAPAVQPAPPEEEPAAPEPSPEIPDAISPSQSEPLMPDPPSDDFGFDNGEVPDLSDEHYVEQESLPLEFARRRKIQRFFIWLLVILAILAVMGWLAYYILTGITNGTIFGFNDPQSGQNQNNTSQQSDTEKYITILEPGDLSSLITSNRGQAEIINELNLEMIRLVSVRNDQDRTQPAKPILLRLRPGVLEQISGKKVTFEIYAKSGTPNPAQFTVKCVFRSLGSCGRKRFRVGLQPEASIFAFDMGKVTDPNVNAYIAINTDTTDIASTTGKGDIIDIVYARLRAN